MYLWVQKQNIDVFLGSEISGFVYLSVKYFRFGWFLVLFVADVYVYVGATITNDIEHTQVYVQGRWFQWDLRTHMSMPQLHGRGPLLFFAEEVVVILVLVMVF